MISLKDYCICLYEIENNLKRTKYCFIPCSGQFELLDLRRKEEEILKTQTTLYHYGNFIYGENWKDKATPIATVKGKVDIGLIRLYGKIYQVRYIKPDENAAFLEDTTLTEIPAVPDDIMQEPFITCPYCGHFELDSCEWADENKSEKCIACGSIFSYQREIETSYSSQPIHSPKIQKPEIVD